MYSDSRIFHILTLQYERNGKAASGRSCIHSSVLVFILRAAEIVSQAYGILG